MANKDTRTLSVIVKNRQKTLFEDKVKAVSSVNIKGVFDILPQHSNFISIIKQHIILHKLDGTKQEIPCQEGVIRVENNIVRVYTDVVAEAKISS